MNDLFRVARLLIAVPLFFVSTARGQAPAVGNHWWNEYTADDVDGANVLGFWKFDGDAQEFLMDRSSFKHPAELRGAKYSRDGRFGGCLESSLGFPLMDQSHSIHVARADVLSPATPFTVELWIRPKTSSEEFPDHIAPVLLDMKYVPTNHSGFMLSMSAARAEQRQLTVAIGLGDHSEMWYSSPIRFTPNWQHIAFSYDAQGTVCFYVNGSLTDQVTHAAGPMSTAVKPLSIGDRMGSNFNGFPGFIDEVRLTRGLRDFRPLQFLPSTNRNVFVRMDPHAQLSGEVLNQTDKPLKQVTVTLQSPYAAATKLSLPPLQAGQRQRIEFPLDASLRPGTYDISLKIDMPRWPSPDSQFQSTIHTSVTIVARPLPHRMPVVNWGFSGTSDVIEEIPRMKELGFTHCFGLSPDYRTIWEHGADAASEASRVREGRDMLDVALENDLQIIVPLSPGYWLNSVAEGRPFQRIDRHGKPYVGASISGLFPEVQSFCFHTGETIGKAYGDHPALAAALLNCESRDGSQVSFHPLEMAAYEQASGGKIPLQVTNKAGIDYRKIDGFPADRVIADDDPILKYLIWFWQSGDGWNELSTRIHEGLKSHLSRDAFWTCHAPACRVPSLSGSGGHVDVLSHWTYSNPDPIRIGLCTDELLEMARVNGREQRIMKMTQLIWYRSQTAPVGSSVPASLSPWEDQDPDAAYITIAPMHLRESVWWKLARPIQGVMFHGWSSLVPTETHSDYAYTNSSTQHELQRLIGEIVVPLGPTLMQIPDGPADVVFLESVTSQIFAQRGTFGWNGTWAGDLYHSLLYAQLQPRVMYEESLLNGELAGAKLLVLADCDVLTQSAVVAIHAFQAAGGLVIGDGDVCPAIKLDKTISRVAIDGRADRRRQQLLSIARELRAWLDDRYVRAVDSDNPDVVTRRRQFGTTDYIFAVNDARQFGSYVGAHGLVLEDGLPSVATIRLDRTQGFVYDLRAARQLEPRTAEGSLKLPLELGPCEGALWMVTQRQIRQVQISVPQAGRCGTTLKVEVVVSDGQHPVDAVIPVHVRITDPEGMEAERSGYYGAANGRLQIDIDSAANDHVGLWQIEVKELASGKTSSAYFSLTENSPSNSAK